MQLSEKIRKIRISEGLTQAKFCEITQLPMGTLKRYEGGKSEPSVGALLHITQHPMFKKYALWLTTDETAPEIGQISPQCSPDSQDMTVDTDECLSGRKI
ncbi:helix-turn-helix transcriptional regulator [Lelliottia amnigena]|uniref:Helix-turn-helix transcriptional regulator n=1 Tax=Lelliottia amnigena TaxID=61646 RepID=A0AAP2F1B1_LELAM|nr:helix-turn-helix transcriptional regulator [Lelliottia amnigena]MBL5901424.1 helix-turn-helix transcriptional regulator [Lelliottia amnigena]MBL5936823.1 helix-turn-helix transcriptional regulator [Lelliottia amnigena]